MFRKIDTRLHGEVRLKGRRVIPRRCDHCGQEFGARIDLIARGGGRFCSKRCGARAKQGTKDRYRGGALNHVVIAERVLEKSLPEGAQVHHVNGDGKDNRHRNLVICQNAAYHRLLHVRARVLAVGGNPNTDRVCVKCHQPIPVVAMRGSDRHGYRCIPCDRETARNSGRRRYWARKAAAHV